MQYLTRSPETVWFKYDVANLSSKHAIRLVEIEPATELPLRCQIRTYCMSAANNLAYTCLSYEWGPSEPEDRMKIILLNDQSFRVRKSLWDFLLTARSRSIAPKSKVCGVKWWIDAICINQNDPQDKNEQVQRMGIIYKNAALVVAWLGGASLDPAIVTNTERLQTWVFDYEEYANANALAMAQNPAIKHDPLQSMKYTTTTRAELQFLIETTHSKYWTRAWIIQEILLARECRLWLAELEISLTRLSELYFQTMNDPSLFEDEPAILARTFAQEAVLWHFAPESLLRWDPTTQRRTLKDLLVEHEDVECFDSRDRVYSLLSLMKAGSSITVDYSGTKIELFFATLWACRDEFCFCLPLLLLQALYPADLDSEALRLASHPETFYVGSGVDRPYLELTYKIPIDAPISGHNKIDQLIREKLVLTCNCNIVQSNVAPDARRNRTTGILVCLISICRLPLPLHILFQCGPLNIYACRGYGTLWNSTSMQGVSLHPDVDEGKRLRLLLTAPALLRFARQIFSRHCNGFCCKTQTTYRILHDFRP